MKNKWLRKSLRSPAILPALFIGLCLFSYCNNWLFTHSGLMRVYFLDVGQGDSALIITPSGKKILIDAGGTQGSADMGRLRVTPALKALGAKHLDLIVFTHPQEDHIGGMESVLKWASASAILEPKPPITPQALTSKLHAIARKHKIMIINAKQGSAFDCGDGVKIKVLWPPPDIPSGDNYVVVVLRVEYKKCAVLFQSDAGTDVEDRLLEQGNDVRANVLKVSHHGSKTGSSLRWLMSVKPDYAIISVGQSNNYGHPHNEVLKRLERANACILRTDVDGAIVMETNGEQLSIRRWRDKSSIPPPRR